MSYATGLGVEKDIPEAVRWFKAAAEQGHEKSQVMLGTMYETGDGVAKDPDEAARWFRKAAAQGNQRAIESLARLGVH